jgi:hypothetical protein
MQTLVKTCMTLIFSRRIDWKDVQNRIVGVHALDEETYKMEFEEEDSITTLISCNHSVEVKILTVYKNKSSTNNGVEKNKKIMRMILDNSDNKNIIITNVTGHYSVTRIDYNGEIDNILTDYYLKDMGYTTMLDFEINDALFVYLNGITWQLFENNGIFVTTGGLKSEEITRSIDVAWLELKKCIRI